MSNLAQIESDAALARRLQEEEFANQVDFNLAPSQPSPFPDRARPEAQSRGRPDNYPFPFAQGQQSFDASDMLGELFRQVANHFQGNNPSNARVNRGISDGLREFGDFPGRQHMFGTETESPHVAMLNSLFQEAFGGMEDGSFRGGSFIMTPNAMRIETEHQHHTHGQGGHGPARGASGPNVRTGRGDGGVRLTEMDMGDGGDINFMFSGMFPGFGQGGNRGLPPNIADWIRNVLPQGLGQGVETYEDMLSIIERMGGNVNRGGTEDEISHLPTTKFRARKPEKPQTRHSGDGAGPSTGAGASGAEEAEKCAICLGEYEEGEDVKTLPCAHMFHAECVDRWLNVNRICPFCKQSIRGSDGEAP